MENDSFKYYAFISYSHKDQDFAKKLQKRIEKYHLPTKIQKSKPDIPKKLRPIFIDEADLVIKGTLKDSLQEKLERSNYLIVICSPNSAKSEYVNDEIKYFINLGRVKHIIPVIVDGMPHSGDSSTECFPPAILELPRELEPLGIDLNTYKENETFIRVMAALLQLELDDFRNRYYDEIRKRAIIFSSMAAVFMILAGVLLWYNIPHYKYYSSYVYRFEKPVGLFEVKSEADRKKMEYTYRFTTLRNRISKIERINSAGILVDPSVITSFTELPMIKFVSDRTVEHYDVNGNKIFRKEYTQNMQAVDFYSGNGDLPYAIKPDMADFYEINKFDSELGSKENNGNIIRLTLYFDDNGYLIRKIFRMNNYGGYDKKGVTVQDEKGRVGFNYKFDELGRVINVRYFDTYRNPVNVNGIYSEQIEYGDSPYPVKFSYADKNGNLISNSEGVALVKISYDEYFNVKKLSCYDAEEKRVSDRRNKISETVFAHNAENGFLISESFYDTELNPCMCEEYYSRVEFARDIEGRITEPLFYNVKGEIIKNTSSDNVADYSAEENFDLGKKYHENKEYKKAFAHYQKAAEQGHAVAQNNLGGMYVNGNGVEKNLQTAYMFCYLAYLSLDKLDEDKLKIIENLKELESRLTEAQITEAKNQAQKKFNEINKGVNH